MLRNLTRSQIIHPGSMLCRSISRGIFNGNTRYISASNLHTWKKFNKSISNVKIHRYESNQDVEIGSRLWKIGIKARNWSSKPENNESNEKKTSNDKSNDNSSSDIDFGATKKAKQAAEVNFSARLSRAGEVKSSATRGELIRLFKLARNEKGPLAIAFIMLIFSSLITLSLPTIIGKILDAVTSKDENKQIWGVPLDQFLMGVGIFFVIGAGANFLRYFLLRIVGERLVSRLRVRLFKRTIQQDAEFFDANRVGELISRLSTDASIVSKSVTQNIAESLKAALTCCFGMGMMTYTSYSLSSAVLMIIPPVLFGTWWYGRKIRMISRQFQDSLGGLTKVAEERLNNAKVTQSFAAEGQEIGRYAEKIRGVMSIAVRDAKATAAFHVAMFLTGNLTVLALLAMGSSMVASGALSIGQLTSFIMYTAYTGGSAAGLGTLYGEIMKGAGAASRLFELLDRSPSIHPTIGQALAQPKGLIQFDHVQFAYPTRPAMTIFKDLDFTITPGSNVCIVGPSGEGKSTITSLLLRFYDPLKGDIRIGGQDLKNVNVRDLRRHIGVVSQEPILFSGTIANNIKYGVPNATRAQVIEAAKKANCKFLSDFPRGLETKVGPRGAQLSGGQKQRIAIARALIKNPSILILDEATSALDSESEALVNEALSRLMTDGSATIISIAHRLSTIRRSDQIIVLGRGGYVAEQGRFVDLYYNPNSELYKLLQERNSEEIRPSRETKEEELEELQEEIGQEEIEREEEEVARKEELEKESREEQVSYDEMPEEERRRDVEERRSS